MLVEELTIRNITFKNRIVMSPMCMYSATPNGQLTPWHITHYVSRAVGGVELIFFGRVLLKDPYWAINMAGKKEKKLYTKAYERAYL